MRQLLDIRCEMESTAGALRLGWSVGSDVRRGGMGGQVGSDRVLVSDRGMEETMPPVTATAFCEGGELRVVSVCNDESEIEKSNVAPGPSVARHLSGTTGHSAHRATPSALVRQRSVRCPLIRAIQSSPQPPPCHGARTGHHHARGHRARCIDQQSPCLIASTAASRDSIALPCPPPLCPVPTCFNGSTLPVVDR